MTALEMLRSKPHIVAANTSDGPIYQYYEPSILEVMETYAQQRERAAFEASREKTQITWFEQDTVRPDLGSHRISEQLKYPTFKEYKERKCQ